MTQKLSEDICDDIVEENSVYEKQSLLQNSTNVYGTTVVDRQTGSFTDTVLDQSSMYQGQKEAEDKEKNEERGTIIGNDGDNESTVLLAVNTTSQSPPNPSAFSSSFGESSTSLVDSKFDDHCTER